MKFSKQTIYISLFAILYLIVAFSSFWHACAFFGLANNSWMSIILAFAFEIGQAAVLFSLLTSKKDRSRIMPWVLMTMFTLVQVIGNVFSSYKYIISNSVENLRFFKEPIFIWTTLPDDQATVIVTYVVGAILPIAALLLTSMITNYLSDKEEELKQLENNTEAKQNQLLDEENKEKIQKVIDETKESGLKLINNEENSLISQNSILQMEKQGLEESNKKKDEEIEELNKKLLDKASRDEYIKNLEEALKNRDNIIENLKNNSNENEEDKNEKEDSQQRMSSTDVGLTPTEESKNDDIPQGESTSESQSDNDNGEQSMDTVEDQTSTEDTTSKDSEKELIESDKKSNKEVSKEISEEVKEVDKNIQLADVLMGGNILKEKNKKPSHFINK